jgi:hypothetical protein
MAVLLVWVQQLARQDPCRFDAASLACGPREPYDLVISEERSPKSR